MSFRKYSKNKHSNPVVGLRRVAMRDLILLNVIRRFRRNVITFFSMMLAALIMLSGFSLSKGIARLQDVDYRDYYRGDIVVFTPGFVGNSPVPPPKQGVQHRLLRDSGFNPLLRLYPYFQTEGYISQENWTYSPISSDLVEQLMLFPEVKAVSYQEFFPASVRGDAACVALAPLNYEDKLYEGRAAQDNASILEVVVNAYGGSSFAVGDLFEVEVPRFALDLNGLPYTVYGVEPAKYPARVVGVVRYPTRQITSYGSMPITEQGYVHEPTVYVTRDRWYRIWDFQSGGADFPTLWLSLSVTDLNRLNIVVGELRREYPDLTILSVPEIARHVERFNLLDKFYRIPEYLWVPYDTQIRQSFVPRDFGLVSTFMLYLVAGMLMGGQMLARVSERKREIATLKALGVKNLEVVYLVMSEGVLVSLAGAFVGFLAIRVVGVYQELSNYTALLIVMKNTAVELILVMGMTSLSALLFGIIPAARVASMSVMEVYRND